MIGTADITADTLTNAIRFAEASFISPIGIGNEAATDGNKNPSCPGRNVIGNLRIADIAGQNYGLAELFFSLRFRISKLSTHRVNHILSIWY